MLGSVARRLGIYGPLHAIRERFRATGASVMNHRAQRQGHRFYGTLVSRGDLVFDVGANIGNRVEIFVALGATVVAIEPQTICVEELRRTFGGSCSVTIEPVAVGAQRGSTTLRLSKKHMLASMSDEFIAATEGAGRFEPTHWSGSETVEVVTLDQLIASHGLPSFCKIDVEGFESQVLAGLSTPIPALSFEYTAEMPGLVAACLDLLEGLGDYEFNHSREESMTWAMEAWGDRTALTADLARGVPGVDWGDVYARLQQSTPGT